MVEAKCSCGCQWVVYWLDDQKRYSSVMLREVYNPEKHFRALCFRCSKAVKQVKAK
jgi:hypothetical protein